MKVKKQVDCIFNIKHWKSLGTQSEKYLGMQWQTVTEGGAVSLCIHMDEYIDNLTAPSGRPSGDPSRPLDAEELAQYRSFAGEGPLACEQGRS